jgi:HSP20 family protein
MSHQTKPASIIFLPAITAMREMNWRPSVDIYRSRSGWLVKLDVAGVRPEDVTVTAQGSRVTVAGHRRDLVVGEDWRHYSMEISYSRFERAIELPCDLDCASVRVEYRDGMLILRIRLKEVEGDK